MSITRSITVGVALGVAVTAIPASAQSIVSPNDRGIYEGSTSSSYPLGRFDGRFQQIHADVSTTAQSLTEHSYRRDATAEHGEVSAYTTELEVTLGVSPNAPTAASSNFAANLGANPVTVLNRTRLSFPSTTRPGTDPAPSFDLRIPYGTPFQLPAGAPLCVDVAVFGNVTSRGPNLNFTAYLDAHEMPSNGSVTQPGYNFDVGCPAVGSSAVHTATFSFDRASDGSLSLDIRSRNGVPSGTNAPARTALVVGFGPQPVVWPFKPTCRLIPSLDASYTLPGDNDSSGAWSGSLIGIPQIVPGQRFVAQLATGATATGDVTFSNAAIVTVPMLPPTALPAVRISAASDHTAATGTVSRIATVTSFR